MVVTEEEWTEWKQHPMTSEFFKALKKEREKIKEQLVLGLFEEEFLAKGIARCLQDLQEMKYDDFKEIVYE